MKHLIFSGIIAITLLASCADKGGPKSNTDSTAAPAIVQVKYACPMHCEGDKTYDQPGKCPKCGMALQEVK